MQLYRLLRNNKETGPFTAEQLLSNGFKPYDLVWAEGKSAGWRYPSELPEFATIVPAVEEDLFTSFYKKPAAKKEPAVQKSSPSVENTMAQAAISSTPVEQTEGKKEAKEPVLLPEVIATTQPVVVSTSSKKVHISLPKVSGKVAATVSTPTQKQDTVASNSPTSKIVAYSTPELDNKTAIPDSPTVTTLPPIDKPIVERASSSTHTIHKTGDIVEASNSVREKISFPFSTKRKINSSSLILGLVFLFGVITLVGLGWVIGTSVNQRALAEEMKQEEEIEKRLNTHVQKKNNSLQVDEEENSTEESDYAETKSSLPDESLIEVNNTNKKTIDNAGKTISPTKNNEKLKPGISEKADGNTLQEGKINNSHLTAGSATTENYANQIEVTTNTYSVGAFGGISNLQCILTNNSSVNFEKVEILIEYLQANKKVFKSETLLIKDVKAGQQMVVDAPKSPRGIKVVSKLVKATLKQSSGSPPLQKS
jgi:hypothetical protein